MEFKQLAAVILHGKRALDEAALAGPKGIDVSANDTTGRRVPSDARTDVRGDVEESSADSETRHLG